MGRVERARTNNQPVSSPRPGFLCRPKLNDARYGYSNRRLGDTTDGTDAEPAEKVPSDSESTTFEGLMGDASNLTAQAVSVTPTLSRHAPRMSLSRGGEAIRCFYFPHEDASMRNPLPPVITPEQYGYERGADSRNVSIMRRLKGGETPFLFQ